MEKSTSNDQVVQWGTKTFYSFDDISFEDIMMILDDWQAGRANAEDVSWFAEGIFIIWGPDCLPDLLPSDPRETLVVFVLLFDRIFSEIILREDIPALKDILLEGQHSPESAFKRFDNYLKGIDLKARQKMVKKRLAKGLGWPS